MRLCYAFAALVLSGGGLVASHDTTTTTKSARLEDVFIPKRTLLGATAEQMVWTGVGYCSDSFGFTEPNKECDCNAAACWGKCEEDHGDTLAAASWGPEWGGWCWCHKRCDCMVNKYYYNKGGAKDGPSTAVVIMPTYAKIPGPCKDESPRWYPRYDNFHETCPYTQGCPDTAEEFCAPACNYDYDLSPARMRKIVHRHMKIFGYIAAGLLVFCLGLRPFCRFCRYVRRGRCRDETGGVVKWSRTLDKKDVRTKLDRLQVAVSLISRLEAVASTSSRLVGFTGFVIASGALKDQRVISAFQEYNIEYMLGYLFLMFSFLLFLLCNFVATTVVLQIKQGYVNGLTAVTTRVFEVFNLIGIICFVQATMSFQSTIGWSDEPHPYIRPPQILGWSFLAVYSLFWFPTFFNVGDLAEEWTTLGGCKGVKADLMSVREHDLFRHFNCKPLSSSAAPPLGSKAKPSYTIRVKPSAGKTPLDIAKANLDKDPENEDLKTTVKLLEDAAERKKLLDEAAKQGKVKEITRLLNDGAEINAATDGATPLYVAAANGHAEAVELLLSRGAEIGLAGPDNAENEGSPTSPLSRGAPPQEDEEAPAAPTRK